MKLTSKEALMMLENARKTAINDGWIKHSICVGNTAATIAKALKLDEEKARTLGYIHDIGKSAEFSNHVMSGYKLLKNLDYDEEYCNVCLTHSYLNNDVKCKAGNPPTRDFDFKNTFITNHEYTIYEKIINLCDLMCSSEVMTMEKRLIDLISRKGANENTQYHVLESLKLKKYFDDQLGFDLYDLIPEVKENL